MPPSLIEENPYETYIQKMLEKGEYSLPSPDHGRITVLPEVTTVVPLSAVDQNRIVCPDLIRDARGSIEKGLLEPQIAGKEVFIKFAWVDTGRGPQYARQPNELFIMCGDERYQLLVRPRKIPTQTIYLSSGLKKRIEQNEGVFKSNSIEESAIKMIALVHNDDLPESFSIREVNRTLNKFKELKTRLKRKVIAEGTGMELYEYEVLLAEGIKEVRLDEDIAKKLAGEEGLLASSAARHQLTRECPECSGTRIFIVKSVFRGN
ncbi:MAG: type-F conjugative transfer system secretin TraK [Nitrospinae bacterium]|nr:type-F conjugative transfer system secretin TraK [Nitrospinota bacterium]